jgi:hypothetical protein
MNNERVFLHDIASPLGAAMFIMDSVIDDLKDRPIPDEEAIQQLVQVQQALEKLKLILQNRKQTLVDAVEKLK